MAAPHRATDAVDLLEGAIDAHVHSSPDVVDRSVSDLEVATRALDAGMDGVVIKNHVVPTVGRVDLANRAVGEEILYGGVVLNGAVGGLNPDAVETALRLNGVLVWLPTLWSRQNAERAWAGGGRIDRGQRAPSPGEELLITSDGELVPEVVSIVDLVAEHDAALATGHTGYEETIAVAAYCRDVGARCLVTHAFSKYIDGTLEKQARLVELGAFLEYCAITLEHDDDHGPADVADGIEQFGPERCVLSSDFGQVGNPMPVDGLADFAEKVVRAGASPRSVRLALTDTPKHVLGLE